MTRENEQKEIEALVKDLESALQRIVTLVSAGALSGGWVYKNSKPFKLTDTEVLRIAILEQILLLTGDYDEDQYESYAAVLRAHQADLEKLKKQPMPIDPAWLKGGAK